MTTIFDGDTAIFSIAEFAMVSYSFLDGELMPWVQGFTMGLQAGTLAPEWAGKVGEYLNAMMSHEIVAKGVRDLIESCPVMEVP